MLARTKQLTYHINHTRKTTIYRLCIISPILLSFCSVISLVISSCKIYTTKDGAGINALCLQNTNTRPRSSARRLYPLTPLPRYWSAMVVGNLSFHSVLFRYCSTFFVPIPLALMPNQYAYASPISKKLLQTLYTYHNLGSVHTCKQQEPDLFAYCFRGYAFNDLHADTALRLFRAVLGLAICAE